MSDDDEAEIALESERPKTRGDCMPGGPLHLRPCPFISCRHHLLGALVSEGGKLHVGGGGGPGCPADSGLRATATRTEVEAFTERTADEIASRTRDTCALDVAERGDHTLEEVAQAIGVLSRERIRQIEAKAIKKVNGTLTSRATKRAPNGRLVAEAVSPRIAGRVLEEFAGTAPARTSYDYSDAAYDEPDSGTVEDYAVEDYTQTI